MFTIFCFLPCKIECKTNAEITFPLLLAWSREWINEWTAKKISKECEQLQKIFLLLGEVSQEKKTNGAEIKAKWNLNYVIWFNTRLQGNSPSPSPNKNNALNLPIWKVGKHIPDVGSLCCVYLQLWSRNFKGKNGQLCLNNSRNPLAKWTNLYHKPGMHGSQRQPSICLWERFGQREIWQLGCSRSEQMSVMLAWVEILILSLSICSTLDKLTSHITCEASTHGVIAHLLQRVVARPSLYHHRAQGLAPRKEPVHSCHDCSYQSISEAVHIPYPKRKRPPGLLFSQQRLLLINRKTKLKVVYLLRNSH